MKLAIEILVYFPRKFCTIVLLMKIAYVSAFFAACSKLQVIKAFSSI